MSTQSLTIGWVMLYTHYTHYIGLVDITLSLVNVPTDPQPPTGATWTVDRRAPLRPLGCGCSHGSRTWRPWRSALKKPGSMGRSRVNDDFRVVEWGFHGDFMVVEWWFNDDFMVVEWWFHDDLMMISWWLNDDFMMILWWLNGGWMMLSWWFHDDFMMI